jgi:hypothetical protein
LPFGRRTDADGKTFEFLDFRGNTFYIRHAALLCDFARIALITSSRF